MRLSRLFATPRRVRHSGFLSSIAIVVASAIAPAVKPDHAPILFARSSIVSHSGTSTAASDSVTADLIQDVIAFFDVWNKAWRYSQLKDWPIAGGKKFGPPVKQGMMRDSYQHCHTRESTKTHEGVVALDGEYSAILSTTSSFSICPSWSLGGPLKFVDGITVSESDSADAAINSAVRPAVRAARARLLESFERAELAYPNDGTIVGQHVRFLLDQGLSDSALMVAKECHSELWWCQLYRGYVYVRRTNFDQASLAFDSANMHMPVNERCSWLDIANLLPAKRREEFTTLSCDARQRTSDRLWWLADPMYSQAGNERRAEHEARNVRLLLQTSFPTDGRFRYWSKENPMDGFVRLITRYGWPGYMGWGGDAVDKAHDSWIESFGNTSQSPYTTYEYFPGRIHTLPSWSALDAPFAVSDTSWDLYGNAPLNHPARWWPDEHMSRVRRLETIPEGQLALMRRDKDVLIASAHELSATSLKSLSDGSVAVMLVTPGPDSVEILGTQQISRSATLEMQGRISSVPTLFALEISDPKPDGVDARTRRGIIPPATLSAMKPGEVALSDPAILRIALGDSGLASPSDALLNQMAGSTNISLASLHRIGVYWESYGIRDNDTVSVSVRMVRRESLSAFRRLGMAINVAGNPNSSVKITWREPDRGHIRRTIDGAVPIQVRTVLLDISNLQPGPYDLITEMSKGPNVIATSSRRISVAR
ncbi:MAG: hypothetical protein ABI852_08960 [Gemmatimonadaceae bacterium]